MKYALVVASLCLSGNVSAADPFPPVVVASHCNSCHQIDRAVVGPAFREVAHTLKGDARAEARIVATIENGSRGKWGLFKMDPMPQVKPADAKAIAAWIMSL